MVEKRAKDNATASDGEQIPRNKGIFDSHMFEDVIEVVVGAEKQSMSIHTSFLAESSPFFKAAIDGSFQESIRRHIALPDDDPKVFMKLLYWMYSGQLSDNVSAPAEDVSKPKRPDEEGKRDEQGMNKRERKCMLLLEVFILADKLAISSIHNLLVDTIIAHLASGTVLHHLMVRRVYDSLPHTSTLRRLAVDWTVRTVFDSRLWGTHYFKEEDSVPFEYYKDCARALAKQLYERLSGPTSPQREQHIYHI